MANTTMVQQIYRYIYRSLLVIMEWVDLEVKTIINLSDLQDYPVSTSYLGLCVFLRWLDCLNTTEILRD